MQRSLQVLAWVALVACSDSSRLNEPSGTPGGARGVEGGSESDGQSSPGDAGRSAHAGDAGETLVQ